MNAPGIAGRDLQRLYGREEIEAAVAGLARAIAGDYSGRPLVLLGVLKAALYFTADLARALSVVPDGPRALSVDYAWASSYGRGTESNASPRVTFDPAARFEGRDVLIADTIVDTGWTLATIRSDLYRRGAATVRQCVLFDKPSGRRTEVPVDYAGLPVPAAFVVGYGLDYQEEYRTMSCLASLKDPERKPTVPSS